MKRLYFLLQHPREGYWIGQEDADDFTSWKRIGIRTKVDTALLVHGDLSSPTGERPLDTPQEQN